MTDPRLEVLDLLLQNTAAALEAFRNGAETIEQFEAAREAGFARLIELDALHGPIATEAHRLKLERLRALNDALMAAVGAALSATEERLRGLNSGRRGLAGYLSAATGPSHSAKLGRG